MENLLLKLAKQLDALDEASLMALWSKYATITSRFEPSRRWEESCLVFSMIQAKHWKNQLFNYHWSKRRQPPLKEEAADMPFPHFFGEKLEAAEVEEAPLAPVEKNPEPCRVLAFKPLPERLRAKLQEED